MQKKNIILIGGNGFIGRSFKAYLSQFGFNIIIIGRSRLPIPKENYFSIHDINIKNPSSFIDTSAENYIVDFAYTSIPNTSFEEPVKDFTENLSNIIQYLEFAKAIDAKKYIYISSGGTVYGNHGNKLLTEDCANFPIAPYGITKLACERYVHMYCEVHRVPGVILRPSNVYGPGQIPFRGQGLVATVMASIFKGQQVLMYGHGETIRDYIYIDDLNKAIFDVLNFGAIGEIYNVGSGKGISTKNMLSLIEDITEPYKIGTKKILPSRPFDIQFNVLDYSKINLLNNWKAEKNLQSGLAITWNWIQQYLSAGNLTTNSFQIL